MNKLPICVSKLAVMLRVYWKFTVLGLLFLFLATTIATLPAPNTFLSASLNAETLLQTVGEGRRVLLPLPRAVHINTDGVASCRTVTDPILVRSGSAVTYSAPIAGDLSITVSRGEQFDTYRVLSSRPSPGDSVEDAALRGACAWEGRMRLPIFGSLVVGMPLIAETGDKLELLLGGSLRIFGRSTETALGGLVPIGFLSSLLSVEPGHLYEVQEVQLIPGSVLGPAIAEEDGSGAPEAVWRGFADVELATGGVTDKAMVIGASANAASLLLQAPVPNDRPNSAAHKDSLSLSLAARLAGDPAVQLFIVIVSFIATVLSAAGQMLSRRSEAANSGPT